VLLRPVYTVEDGKPAKQGGSLGLMNAQKGQSLCADKGSERGPAESLDLLSCDGGYLRPFREQFRGFLDLLRQKPSSMSALLGWSTISISSLTMQSYTFS
jgi:hypothetical protein